MYDLIAVTNRHLCREDFLERIQLLVDCGVPKILLREKDLTPEEYKVLASAVLSICKDTKTKCILHHFADVAMDLETDAIHLSLPVAKIKQEQLLAFSCVGISTHSIEQVKEAEALGASYVTYGHVFSTDCKKGVPPRGLLSLAEIAKGTSLPVYAIGGIRTDNLRQAVFAGAEGVCIMSYAMQAEAEALRRLLEL